MTSKVVVDVAGAMDKITPELMEAMAPILTNPMIAALEAECERRHKRIKELEAVLKKHEVVWAATLEQTVVHGAQILEEITAVLEKE